MHILNIYYEPAATLAAADTAENPRVYFLSARNEHAVQRELVTQALSQVWGRRFSEFRGWVAAKKGKSVLDKGFHMYQGLGAKETLCSGRMQEGLVKLCCRREGCGKGGRRSLRPRSSRSFVFILRTICWSERWEGRAWRRRVCARTFWPLCIRTSFLQSLLVGVVRSQEANSTRYSSSPFLAAWRGRASVGQSDASPWDIDPGGRA